jgi:hypothetical protein
MDWNFNVIMDVFDNLQTIYQDQGYLNNSESTGFIEMIMNNVNLYHRRSGNKLQKNRNTENTLTENTLTENTHDNKNDDDSI